MPMCAGITSLYGVPKNALPLEGTEVPGESHLFRKPLDMSASPYPDGVCDRQDGASVLGERVDDRRGNASSALPVDDSVGDQLAQLAARPGS